MEPGWGHAIAAPLRYRVITVLLVGVAAALLFGHEVTEPAALISSGSPALAGVVAGFAIGVVAALMAENC